MTYIIKTTGKREIPYNIEGIKKGDRRGEKTRRELILQIIRQNPRIFHTHVIQIAYEFSSISKKTIELDLNRMENDGLIKSSKLGNSPNALRIWNIFQLNEKDLDESIGLILDGLLKTTKELIKKCKESDSKKQAEIISAYLDTLTALEPLIIIMDKNLEKHEQKEKYDLLKNTFYPLILRNNEDVFAELCYGYFIPNIKRTTNKLSTVLELQKK
jgi:hypothetical protein